MHAALTFEVERLGDHADGEDALVRVPRGDNRGGTGAGAAAHAGGDEAHVGAVEMIDDLIDALFGGRAADFRLRTGAEAFGHATPSWTSRSALDIVSAWASVLATTKSTPSVPH
jgi:hypothetical protein